MRRPITSLLAVAALSSFAGLGCTDDPPTPPELRSQISSDLGNVLHETNAAFAGGTASVPGTTALAMVDRVLGSDTTLSLRVHELAAPFVGGDPKADPPANDLIDADAEISYLNDQLFTDANHVGNGVYQVPASLVCSQTTVDASGNPVKTIDPKCADQLAKADLRIRVARDDGALIFAIQVDADHDEPLRFTLTHTSVAVTVDLDGMQRAIVALAAVFGQDVPNIDLAGQATAKLEILGTAKARASITIDRDLSIKAAKTGATLDGPDALVLTSAKANAFSITLDGHAKSGTLALGLGETTLKLPEFTNSKRFELDLPGATATATFAQGQPLALSHIGLGSRTTTVSLSGVRAETIDLNPQDGRAFDATVSVDAATSKETIAVTPRLDLQVSVDHAVLGDTPPVYDITRVQLEGSVRTSDASNQIEVVTGSFGFTTNPAGHGFSASAGQCVTSSSAVDAATGRSYTQYTVGACL
ncbi:MAG: hypothetical protein E6J90_09485 [Deltaproteobacteria bacterium]|nr:MAG: hypothetical protein E6J91_36415 [Deltaproteobacteria bacterium]TMQ23930.1 MAG: hypothetical protein E6J90_09485 [Deltaproteobacteria bacterium]